MSARFGWPDMPPIDIRRVADLIQIKWLEMTRKAELEAQKDAAMMLPIGIPHDYGYGRWQLTVGSELGAGIIEILTAYDEGRTRQIEFLKSELIRLHCLMPQPIFIGKKPEDL